MANPERRPDDNAGKVLVRVLCEVYGSHASPLGRKGDTIYVEPAEYERLKGSISVTDGKLKGGSLRLVDDEKKAAAKVEDEARRLQARHDAGKAAFQAQFEAARRAQEMKAKADADAAAARLAALKGK